MALLPLGVLDATAFCMVLFPLSVLPSLIVRLGFVSLGRVSRGMAIGYLAMGTAASHAGLAWCGVWFSTTGGYTGTLVLLLYNVIGILAAPLAGMLGMWIGGVLSQPRAD